MATNKLLKPTNVTIAIPAMADKPNQSVNSNCIDKEADAINALNDRMTGLVSISKVVTSNRVYTFTMANASQGILIPANLAPISMMMTSGTDFYTSDLPTGLSLTASGNNVTFERASGSEVMLTILLFK